MQCDQQRWRSSACVAVVRRSGRASVCARRRNTQHACLPVAKGGCRPLSQCRADSTTTEEEEETDNIMIITLCQRTGQRASRDSSVLTRVFAAMEATVAQCLVAEGT